MKSQWYEFKPKVIAYRKKGYSLRMIEKKLNIPRSTLSGWVKGVVLTEPQRAKLLKNWHNALNEARKEAVKWHNSQKQHRLQQAKLSALATLARIKIDNKDVLELALAMLYLGEGFKSSAGTGIGNSSPTILRFFINGLVQAYNFDISKIKCELHLRADQSEEPIRKYWSKELGIPLSNFTSVSIDQRTKGSVTYEHYKGVCVLRCSSAEIQRRLLFLAEEYCNNIVNKNSGG